MRKFGLLKPIAVVPNGVSVPTVSALHAHARVVHENWPHLSDKKCLLFMSRLHPHKGLKMLLSVWFKLCESYRDWHLVVAGPDEAGLRAELEAWVAANDAKSQTSFLGPIFDERKWSLLASCAVFVLPSRSENFGIAIAEALACGRPVIATKGAPWPELETHRCGWWIENGDTHLERALRVAIETPSQQRGEMGLRGKALIETNYSWPRVAAQMLGVYRWLLGQANLPSCVRI